MRVSQRAQAIEPFHVMQMGKAAQAWAEQWAHLPTSPGEMIHLNIGEPDFKAAPLVQDAAQRAIEFGLTQYTPANGLEALRQAISDWYAKRWHLEIDPSRITITAGASAALLLSCLALIESGDEILMPDPSYPCNRHFVTAAAGVTRLLPCSSAQRYQLNAQQVEQAWGPHTRGVMLASPSNPTGTSISFEALRDIHQVVKAHQGVTMVDEIYLGLQHDTHAQSALALGEDIVSINSFSKYFNMTGWRLGWLVTSAPLAEVIERLAQNLFICPSTLAQHAALACFEQESLALFEQRKKSFQERRDYLLPQLQALGFEISCVPDGAFYIWADCRGLYSTMGVENSWDFTIQLMQQAHVVLAPGMDFGAHEAPHFVRISTASSMQDLQASVQRMKQLWSKP